MPEGTQRAGVTWLHRLGALGYRAFCLALRLTNVRLVALVGRGAGYLVWACVPSRRRIVARNLRIVVDPTLRQDKLSPMVRRNIVRTCMNLACSLKTGLMSDRELQRSVVIEGGDVFEHAGLEGHTGISCIPHAGNWEILARIRPLFSRVEHYGSMYRRMSNPLLENMVYKSRTGYGCEMFSKEDGLRAALRLARGGGLLGVLSDQFTQEGIFLPYFGKVTGVTPLPALIYKRCKGKGYLFSVFTRNTGLGRWAAILGRQIELEEGEDSLAAITMKVNQALEKCQSENILDGFWMHHRWKSTRNFAPPQDEETTQVARRGTRLPFRILLCVPEAFEEAVLLTPVARLLKRCRHDMQVLVLCPEAQREFWEAQQEHVAYVVTTDGASSLVKQLEEERLYREGPYDVLFMFSENRRVWRQLKHFQPLHVSGFAENPFSRAFRTRYSCAWQGPPRHRMEDFLTALRSHGVPVEEASAFAPIACGERGGEEQGSASFIAPFSTLGEADSWPEERWKELVSQLPGEVSLLALQEDEERARGMAERLGIPLVSVRAGDLSRMPGVGAHLYAVDGLLPQLAALCGCTCTVLMASRLAERYRPLGKQHRTVYKHSPCHPCYRRDCDASACCTEGVSVADMLG